MNAQWNAPISDRFSSLCARVFSPAAAILESEKTLGTRLNKMADKALISGPKRLSSGRCVPVTVSSLKVNAREPRTRVKDRAKNGASETAGKG